MRSTATKNALETEGKADAEAASIYAAAFNPPDAQELYSFLRSLDVMRAAVDKDTTAVISTNSDLGRLLKSMAEAVGAPKPGHEGTNLAAGSKSLSLKWVRTKA